MILNDNPDVLQRKNHELEQALKLARSANDDLK